MSRRAVSVDEMLKKKFKILELVGEWLEMLGKPEANGTWIIWGKSGSGKSVLSMLVAKMLTEFGKVAYDALEEGSRLTMQKRIIDFGMTEDKVRRNFVILNREPIEILKERLRKPKHPTIVFIDSVQYSGLTKKQYIALKEEFTDVLFIFISHAEGTEPLGSLASFIRYDADVKIRVEGYKAFPVSRYGGGKEFTIWPEEAAKYWVQLQ